MCLSSISIIQVKIANAKKGLVHVSQNIPTKSSLSVSLVRPEDLIIQVVVIILLAIILIILIVLPLLLRIIVVFIIKVLKSESSQVAAVGPKESSMSFNLVSNQLSLKISFDH